MPTSTMTRNSEPRDGSDKSRVYNYPMDSLRLSIRRLIYNARLQSVTSCKKCELRKESWNVVYREPPTLMNR